MDNSAAKTGKRIVLTTFGSFGDLHPYIALAVELKRRGHRPLVATHEPYRAKIEGEGVDFSPIRPGMEDLERDPELMRKVMDLRKGPEMVINQLVMPNLRGSFEDIDSTSEGADLFVSHPLTYATRMVAERRGLPWVGIALSPVSFFSAYDPSVLAPMPHLIRLRILGPRLYGALLRAGQRSVASWAEPVHALRKELGLPPLAENPIFGGQFSPYLNLALFSHVLGDPQPDWPDNTRVCGFAFYDRLEAGSGLPIEFEQFLAEGEPPIVFTLGSAAVMDAGRFFQESLKAAAEVGRRAVLLIGRDPRNRLADLPPGIAQFDYAPYSELFPRAAVNVHQGGVGTTGQALRAGRPMIVMPYGHDQPDNAYRVERLGVARTIPRARYSVRTAANALTALLSNSRFAERAAEVGREVQQENGTAAACDALEGLLNGTISLRPPQLSAP